MPRSSPHLGCCSCPPHLSRDCTGHTVLIAVLSARQQQVARQKVCRPGCAQSGSGKPSQEASSTALQARAARPPRSFRVLICLCDLVLLVAGTDCVQGQLLKDMHNRWLPACRYRRGAARRGRPPSSSDERMWDEVCHRQAARVGRDQQAVAQGPAECAHQHATVPDDDRLPACPDHHLTRHRLRQGCPRYCHSAAWHRSSVSVGINMPS